MTPALERVVKTGFVMGCFCALLIVFWSRGGLPVVVLHMPYSAAGKQ
jgi:hypothetical protein